MAKKSKRTREQVYDAEIAPLVGQIIGLCKRHKIPMIANFNLDHDGDGLQCTTNIFGDDWEPTEGMRQAYLAMAPRESHVTMITTRDGGGNVTRMDAVVE